MIKNILLTVFSSFVLSLFLQVFVYENNIYYQDDPASGLEPVQVTQTGQSQLVFNGIPDWLYEGATTIISDIPTKLLPTANCTIIFNFKLKRRGLVSKRTFRSCAWFMVSEEILKSNSALWWSTDSLYVAYLEINDSNVPVYHYPEYGAYGNIYGDIKDMPYPKVRI